MKLAIDAVGAQLWFLPKYSPDLNPIQLAFTKLKAILRKARCRTREVLWATIGAAVPRYEPTECRNYSRHCGYSAAYGLIKSALGDSQSCQTRPILEEHCSAPSFGQRLRAVSAADVRPRGAACGLSLLKTSNRRLVLDRQRCATQAPNATRRIPLGGAAGTTLA